MKIQHENFTSHCFFIESKFRSCNIDTTKLFFLLRYFYTYFKVICRMSQSSNEMFISRGILCWILKSKITKKEALFVTTKLQESFLKISPFPKLWIETRQMHRAQTFVKIINFSASIKFSKVRSILFDSGKCGTRWPVSALIGRQIRNGKCC